MEPPPPQRPESSPIPSSSSNFRRGQSKVFYASDAVWDTGQTNQQQISPEKEGNNLHNSDGDDSDHSSSGSSVGEHLKNAMLNHSVTPILHHAQPATVVKPIPLLGHRLNRSAELDDILEESIDEEDEDEDIIAAGASSPGCVVSSPSPPASSSSPSSNSPEGSFRMPRGTNARRSRDSQESSTDSSDSTRFRKNPNYSKRGNGNHYSNKTSAVRSPHHHLDSGFSDSGESGNADGNGNGKGMHSEVVHETRTNSFDQRQYHVSKVYFYSVSDILSEENDRRSRSAAAAAAAERAGYCSRGEADHVSVLDCETFHKEQQREAGYDEEEVILTPPMATPPLPQPLSSHPVDESNQDCDSRVNDNRRHDGGGGFSQILEHKPLPPRRLTGQLSPRIHNGTSSLGRMTQISPVSTTSSSSNSTSHHHTQFPKTNGSLYESLSLGREEAARVRAHFNPGKREPLHSSRNLEANSYYYGNGSAPNSPRFHHNHSESFSSLPPNVDCPPSSLDESSSSLACVDPVAYWLRELSLVHEAECTIMLQSKPVSPAEQARQIQQQQQQQASAASKAKEGRLTGLALWGAGAGNSKDTIRAIQARAQSISAAFAKLCRQLGHKSLSSLTSSSEHVAASEEHAGCNGVSPSSSSAGGVSKLVPLVQGLSHQVHLFLVEYNKYNNLKLNLPGYRPRNGKAASRVRVDCPRVESPEVPEEILHQQRMLLHNCDRLKLSVSRHQSKGLSLSGGQNMADVVEVVTKLAANFTKLIELMLSKEIKLSVDSLRENSPGSSRRQSRESPSPSSNVVLAPLRHSVDCIIGLALEGNHLCRLIAKHGGIRALLTICVDPNLRAVRVASFRALGTVCCVLEGIMELEEAGGIEILSDTLRDCDAAEEEKSEAAGLLAQVTSPWIENNSSIDGLSRHLGQLVESLTALSKRTKSSETFLLSSAALANLTFMEPSVVGLMRRHNTVKVLVAAIRLQRSVSIYIQDQVAAVLANMAASADCREEVTRNGGIKVLLQFLDAGSHTAGNAAAAGETRATHAQGGGPGDHSHNQNERRQPEDFAQMAATERVLQKSAIALSRLCNEPSLAEQVVQLDGLRRLVELCKNEDSRLGSDGVLVACLAAVRKIASACGTARFEALDASELVEPRLLDSFLIFSSKNESFV